MSSSTADGTLFAGNLKGCLAEVYFWNVALQADVVQALTFGFNSQEPSLTSLVAYYAFEQSSGDRFLSAPEFNRVWPEARLLGR
jgi:hypothetical protein